jgi:hypothetical protein
MSVRAPYRRPLSSAIITTAPLLALLAACSSTSSLGASSSAGGFDGGGDSSTANPGPRDDGGTFPSNDSGASPSDDGGTSPSNDGGAPPSNDGGGGTCPSYADSGMAQAGINVLVARGTNSATQCPIVVAGVGWGIGGPTLAPVANGQCSNGDPVSVACRVASQDAGFAVGGTVVLDGTGLFSINGTFDGTTNPQSGITGSFVLPNGLGAWQNATCTVTFPDSEMGIAPGRVWAAIDCPTMVDPGEGTQCEGTAEFRLENCTK